MFGHYSYQIICIGKKKKKAKAVGLQNFCVLNIWDLSQGINNHCVAKIFFA